MDTNKIITLMPDMASFVAVVEAGSFSAAAKRMGMTPSATSRQISRLETALSIKLLERTTRKVALTEAGKGVYATCRNMLDNAREVVDQSASFSAIPQGKLRISAPKAYAKQVLEPMLLTFVAEFPDIQLHMMVTDRFVNPVDDEVDVIFRITQSPVEGLVGQKVSTVASVLVASPAYLKSRGQPVHPLELNQHECIALGEDPADALWRFRDQGKEVSLRVHGRYTANHTEMRLNAVKANLGIALLPDFVAKAGLANGELVQVLVDYPLVGGYQGGVYLQYAQSKYVPTAIKAFVGFVKAFN